MLWVVFGYIAPCLTLCSVYFYCIHFTRRYTIRLIEWSSKKQQPFVRAVQRIRLTIPPTAKGPADYAVLSYTLGVPDIKYQRRSFQSRLFDGLGSISIDQVLVPNAHANILICTPMAASARAPCIKRLVSAATTEGYNCYVLISRGYGGTILDSDTQEKYLDEYLNIHDIYETIYDLLQSSDLPIHLVGFSLGGMRMCHFIGDLVIKAGLVNGSQEDVSQEASTLHEHYFARLNLVNIDLNKRQLVTKIYKSITSISILFANLDKRQAYLKNLKAHISIGFYQREYIAKNKAALEEYAQRAGKDIDFDSILQNPGLKAMQDFDREVFARLVAPSQSLDEYYDLIFPSAVCLEAVAILSRTIPILFLGAYDDTVTGPLLPILAHMTDSYQGKANLFTRSSARNQIVVIQYRQGEHLGIIGANGKDAASLVMIQWLAQFSIC